MIKKLMILLLAAVLLVSISAPIQAVVMISQPRAVYNLGDSINIDLKIAHGQDISVFFRIVLVCNNKETLVYFSPLKLEKDREKSIEIEWPVSKALGKCKISAEIFAEDNVIEKAESPPFELTDKIDIEATLNKNLFTTSEQLKLNGKAIKKNGDAFKGSVVVSIGQKEYIVETSAGSFSFSLQLEAGATPGKHEIKISAKDGYGNVGSTALSFEIEAIPTSLVIETNNKSFLPRELLVIKPKLLDQVGNILAKNIYVKLSTPKESFFGKESVLLEEFVMSNNSTKYYFPKDAKPGIYNIKASFESFEDEKSIQVLVFERLNFSIENGTLYVENIGNVPYRKPIQINFKIENQTTTKVIELNLDVGENKTFELQAPKGTYEIEITTGNESAVFDSVPLTGNLVAISELKADKIKQKNFGIWVVWAVLGAAIVIALVLFARKKRKHKTSLINRTKKVANNAVVKIEKDNSTLKTAFAKYSSKLAASSLIPMLVYGTKQELTTLAVKLEGIKDVDKTDQFLASAVEKIKAHQGVADIHNNMLIVMFNIIKQQRHEMAAIKVAQEIRDIAAKMNFKIRAGINTGMATISSIGADKSVSYNQIGRSVSLAKELATKAQEYEILISEETYKRVGSAIKTRKTTPHYISDKEAIEVYALSDASPSDTKENYQWFINRALGK